MKKLEFLTQAAVAPSRYPKRVRSLRILQLEEKNLNGPYIGDQLDHDLERWTPERAIVLSAPTGSGKTTFVIKKIISRAVKRSENVLIITNRNPLNLAYKKDIAKAVGMSDEFTDAGLTRRTDFGNVFVVNYQGFKAFIKAHKHLYFRYVVADECHYFLQDAPFSDCTDHVLNSIKKYFFDAIRIYVSATIEEILPFIILAEIPEIEVAYNGVPALKNPNKNRLANIYAMLPQVYTIKADYSRLNLHFYTDTSGLASYINSRTDKAIFFCSSIKGCENIKALIPDTLVIYADFLNENPAVLKGLVESKKFFQKCLATTSVFSNGNSIIDSKVKTVAIELIDPTELLQMAGRRRLDYSNPCDSFDLYLKIPELSDLEKQFKECKRKLKLIDRCETNSKKVLYAMKSNEPDDLFIRSVYKVDTEGFGYVLNQLSYDKLYMDMKYAEFIYALIEAGGEKAYCQYVCEFFSKDFDDAMLTCSLQDCYVQLEEYVISQCWPMDKETFQSFCRDFQSKKIKLFGKSPSDNTSSVRKAPGMRWLNNRFADYNIPLQVVEKNNCFNISEKDTAS